MSDKNIDKDIERINNIIHCHDGTRVHYIDISYSLSAYDDSDDCEKFVIAIENVLSELEETKATLKCTQDSWYKDTQESETWKKIAEKLAIEVENLDDMLSAELGSHTRGYCKIENSCILNHKKKCSECIIDWARNEVENGKNNNR